MADSQRLEMLRLADAIRRCQANGAITEDNKSRLNLALELARLGSKFVGTSEALVDGAKVELCAACRKGSLYACDMEQGWSTTCVLLRANDGQQVELGPSDKSP